MSERARERRRVEREMLRRQYEMYDPQFADLPTPIEEQRHARRMTWIKLGLAFTGLGMLACTSLTMLALILTPIWFRGLPTSEQVIWMNRLPFLETFKPTRVYSADALPTAAGGGDAALALLSSTVIPASPVAGSDPGGALNAGGESIDVAGSGGLVGGASTGTSTPAELMGAIPSPTLTPTLPFMAGATSILATNTPVIAPLAATPTPVPSRPPELTPTPFPTLPPPPPPTSVPIPVAFQGDGFKFEKQQWNTCGPANLTQSLRYLGWTGTQRMVVDVLKPNRDDRNVSPWELVNYVNQNVYHDQGVPLKALMRIGGNMGLVKRLVANGFGVILEKGYNLPAEGWLGHYLTVQGYDDSRGEMHGLDTYLGDRWETYETLDNRWQQFNRLFIVIFPADRERELALLLGEHRDVSYSVQYALSVAKNEAIAQADNPYAWFNMGTAYVMLGEYDKAVSAFDQSRNVGGGLPWRMLWYQFGPYEAYYNAGNYNEVLNLAQTTLNTSSDLEESHYWQGMALAAQGKYDAARSAFQRALNINPNFALASERLAQIQNGTFRPPKVG